MVNTQYQYQYLQEAKDNTQYQYQYCQDAEVNTQYQYRAQGQYLNTNTRYCWPLQSSVVQKPDFYRARRASGIWGKARSGVGPFRASSKKVAFYLIRSVFCY